MGDLQNNSLREQINSQVLANENARMQNDITRGTKNSHIGAVNAKNYLSQTIGNYMTDQTKLQHKSIQSQNVLVRDRNGKYRQATPQEVQDPNKIKYKNTQ